MKSSEFDNIVIVGGGLSGLTLGILLRQRDVPVTILEAQSYPRHKVCGEFLCGKAPDILHEMGVLDLLHDRGAVWCRKMTFLNGHQSSGMLQIPQAALCISRYLLDDILASEFTRLGGCLRTGVRFTGAFSHPGVIRATGRIPLTKPSPQKWVGLKAHLTHAPPIDHLQMHRVPLGYIGVSPIENGHINVCGLFDFTSLHPKPDNLHATLLGSLDHSPLGALIRSGTLESDSFCSISNLNLIPASLHSHPHEWRIGDSFSMIPPFTGNGMSMAMESARIALPYVLNASLHQASWSTQRTHFHQRLSHHFRPRLTAAHYLHKSLLTPQLGPFLFTHLPRSRPLFHALFALTH